MNSYLCEQLDNLRRIAERGKAYAEETQWPGLDLWIHMLDEIQRTQNETNPGASE